VVVFDFNKVASVQSLNFQIRASVECTRAYFSAGQKPQDNWSCVCRAHGATQTGRPPRGSSLALLLPFESFNLNLSFMNLCAEHDTSFYPRSASLT
jgi:hypothetical protein